MAKKERIKPKKDEGLNRKQIIGLGLILIFLLSILAYGAIQAGV